MKDFIIMNHQKIKTELKLVDEISIFIFGSLLQKKQSHDIDLLVLYNKEKISTQAILLYRINLAKAMEKEYGIFCDICLLSFDEEKQVSFAKHEKAIKLI